MSSPLLKAATPWSRIPTHMLGASSDMPSHVRFYSADSRDSSDGDDKSGKITSQILPGLASSFGFQSLSGLFQQQTSSQGRYSRPREPEQDETSVSAPPKQESTVAPPKHAEPIESAPPKQGLSLSPTNQAGPTKMTADAEQEFFRPSNWRANALPLAEADGTETAGAAHPFIRPLEPSKPTKSSQSVGPSRSTDSGNPVASPVKLMAGTRRRRIIRGYPSSEGPFTDRQERVPGRQTNPFAASSSPPQALKRIVPVPPANANQSWGLSPRDMETVDSIIDPSAGVSAPQKTNRVATVPSAVANTTADQSSRLTHVTPTGEAHMVDVGAKPASRRVAIAGACVRFSNPEPFRLIFENSNKKGDVLGVARVAGIMAAKRTSDLIPLCHPLAISKVNVDVKLGTPGSHGLYAQVGNKYGIVIVQAQVECVGPTGVEMEALTAASAAALTVYDMCKAVDRAMRLQDVRVLYKMGGRSGVHCQNKWAHVVGRRWFDENRLEPPQIDWPIEVSSGGNGRE